ncbi:MAG: uracil-DNA glycosylase family protein [Candidatus Nomurabacteria bacterium]
MQTTEIFEELNKLHKIYGDKNLDSIYGCGKINKPKLCLVFMNPTARNVAANKSWKGLKAPWIGTKNVWNMFFQLGLINEKLIQEINDKKPSDWDYDFSEKVYKEIIKNNIYITNLSKATQLDARPLPDEVFQQYLNIFKREIDIVKPKVIITFGNQVSSVLLGMDIRVSEHRKKFEELEINNKKYKVYPVYYPVGQGMRNIKLAKEDINFILKTI